MQKRTNGKPRTTRPYLPQTKQSAAQRQLYREFAQWGADERRWRPETRRVYVVVVRKCDVWLRSNGDQGAARATPEQLRAFLWTTPDTAASRGLASKALRAFGTFLVATGRRKDDPAATLPSFAARQGVPKSIERHQAQLLLHAARSRGVVWQALVTVALFTGLRRSEIAAVRWRDIEGRWLRVPDGKGGKERMIPLHPRAWAALERIRHLNLNGEWVFCSQDTGQPFSPGWIAVRVRAIGKDAGLDLTTHVLRHTFATLLLEGSGDIRIVQDALGHASLQTTQIYTRVRPERMRDAVTALSI